MARIIGNVFTSHVPAIGGAIAKGRTQDGYWKPFFDGFPPLRHWVGEVKPDVVVVCYNDHGLNFFLDKMPTFAIGAAESYRNADEDGYCTRYGLNAGQREAIRQRNVLRLLAAGGNAYYLAKFAGIFGLDMQDIGAQQTGLTKDEFKARLVAAGR